MDKHFAIPNRADVAKRLGTSDQYLYQIETKRRLASRLMAEAIERETAGSVTRYDLRPDIFGEAPDKEAAA